MRVFFGRSVSACLVFVVFSVFLSVVLLICSNKPAGVDGAGVDGAGGGGGGGGGGAGTSGGGATGGGTSSFSSSNSTVVGGRVGYWSGDNVLVSIFAGGLDGGSAT